LERITHCYQGVHSNTLDTFERPVKTHLTSLTTHNV